jgi:hypothetical protein
VSVREWPIGDAAEEIEQRALLLIAFADGFEESGLTMTARRMRVVARDVLYLLAQRDGPGLQPTEEDKR